MEKVRNLINRINQILRSRWFAWLCFGLIIVCGYVYIYYIHTNWHPNSEDVGYVNSVKFKLEDGTLYKYILKNPILTIITATIYRIWGTSFFSIRIAFTTIYMMIATMTIYLCMKRKDRYEVATLPVGVFFVLLIHVVGFEWGYAQYGMGVGYGYPYDSHQSSIYRALICLIMLTLSCYTDAYKKKRLLIIITLITIAYCTFSYADSLYWMIFLVPLLIVVFFKVFYLNQYRKWCMIPAVIFSISMFVTRFFVKKSSIAKLLWSKTETWAYDPNGLVWGGSNWVQLDNLPYNFNSYIRMLLQLFNIDFSKKPFASFFSVIYLTRLFFLVLGIIIVIRICYATIFGKSKEYGYELIDEILAWGFFDLSFIWIFTRYGTWEIKRCFTFLVVSLTILLCRNLVKTFGKTTIWKNIKQVDGFKVAFIIYMSVVCTCYISPVWMYTNKTPIGEEQYDKAESIVKWIEANYDDKTVLVPYWLFGWMDVINEKEDIRYYNSIERLRSYEKEKETPDIIVVNFNDDTSWSVLSSGVVQWTGETYEDMCENYRTPSSNVRFDDVDVYVFK